VDHAGPGGPAVLRRPRAQRLAERRQRPALGLTVKVWEARALAARWVAEHDAELPGFAGAFLGGSAAWLPAGADLPATSDVDVMVVTAAPHAPLKLGKLRFEGVLLDVGFLSWDQLGPGEAVLAAYHLAGSFRSDTILADPSGRLAELHAAVSRNYAKRSWVRRRCEHAERRIVDGLGRLDASQPFHDQVTAWLFPTGVTTHVLLTAGLRNPTVRLRYLAARDLLHQYGHEGFHEELLRLLGCAHLPRGRVLHHLRAMAAAFDAAAAVARTPFPFAADVTTAARPIAVDGSRALVDQDRHREAVFWIVATSARCQKLLAADAPPAARARHSPGFGELLGDLGVASPGDLRRRAQDVLAFLPRLRQVTEAILAANPDVEDDPAPSTR
jgi:hypothetical protein